MTPEEFVKGFHTEKQNLLDLYFGAETQSEVCRLIKSMDLDQKKQNSLRLILEASLRDAFYTILLGLDGEASIGDNQQNYKLFDEDNNELTGGEIESFAWEYFQNEPE